RAPNTSTARCAMPRRPSVLFLVEGDPSHPIAFYRGHLPARALRMRRWQAFASPEGVVWKDGRIGYPNVDPTDIVVLRRPVHDDGSTFDLTESIQAAREAGQTIYSDLDDDYWHLPSTNPASKLVNAESLALWDANIAASDGLLCSTPGLAQSMGSHLDVPIHVCPNGIDPALYVPKEGENEPLRVGWLGPWNWRRDDLASAADWLVPMLNDRADRVVFVHIGATPEDDGRVEDILQGHKFRVERVPWVPFICLDQSIKKVDVMLIPQRLGGEYEAFANARSPTSAIASIASGVPVWATPIDSYRRFFGDALPETPEELLDSKAIRKYYKRAQKALLGKVNLEATAMAYEKVFLATVKP
ncbi:MAG: hypothetical protein ACREMY_01870, partial [bacterium]